MNKFGLAMAAIVGITCSSVALKPGTEWVQVVEEIAT